VVVSTSLVLDEDLIQRLPLPLARLYRRAHNAKTAQERHHAAYYLWEAALKLLGAAAVVEYAELGDHDPDLAGRLESLARPSLGHWWEFLRRLVPVLANHRDAGFATVRELLLGKSRDDLPYAAGLDGVLIQVLEQRAAAESRATVRPTELFDRLVRYRNREFGHGALGQRPAAFYERVGRALLAGVPEVLGHLDVLAGRRLVYVSDVHRHASGRWLVERYELRGETARRLDPLDLPDADTVRGQLPDRVYLESPGAPAEGKAPPVTDSRPRTVSLHPLLIYEADANDVLFLNARRGRQRIAYLSYSTGKELERDDLASEQRALLARVLHLPADAAGPAARAARSQAEEQVDGGSDETPAARRRLGEFELLSELGRGGMGVVYRAWQPSLGRQVAVKALYRSGDPKAEARFAREIRALGHVEHPHLVKIFTSGADGEQWFYAMELVEGAMLAAVCEKLQSRSSPPATVDLGTWQRAVSTVCAEARQAEKPLSGAPAGAGGQATAGAATPGLDTARPPLRVGQSYVRQVVELVKQVAEAAHALHERGILHRDIKPGNVMVTTDGSQAALMDLGLAQIADEVEGRLTRTRQFVGTLRYASPEQVLAVGGLDRRSDVYNLGATLWELLTLRPMFGATEQTPTPELMRRIQYQEPERPRKYHPRLARDLEAIVLKCLEKDPKRRYATAHELVRDLQRYQAGESVVARPVGRAQRGWRWCRRNPVAAALGGVCVSAVGAVFALVAGYNLYLEGRVRQAVAGEQQQRREAEQAHERERRGILFREQKYEKMADLLAGLQYRLAELDAVPPREPRQDVHLTVGLASESRFAVREGFEAYHKLRAAFYRQHGHSFTIDVDCLEDGYTYERAFEQFRGDGGRRYDILLVDDPWLPALRDKLTPLPSVEGFHEYWQRHPPLSPFVPSLAQVCRASEGGPLYGLPLVANVQVLLYRKDLVPDGAAISPEQRDVTRLDAVRELCARHRGGPALPFAVRCGDVNSIAEQFWEVLRCYDYRDRLEDGRVIIPRDLALKAFRWLREADPSATALGHDDDFLTAGLLAEQSPGVRMGFGWPTWVMRRQVEEGDRPGLVGRVGSCQISSNPLLGAWLLVIPRSCTCKEEALRAVLALTTSAEFQAYLAERGCVPVLREDLSPSQLGDVPFLSEPANYATIRRALEQSSPRPRTPDWKRIEEELGRSFLEGSEPQSIEGCLKIE
jgi:serine/threonine protein kinase/ABC-type glycerol-3-phosphate transport system substrate-binding protein